MKEYQYFTVKRRGSSKSGKTHIYDCENVSSGQVIGTIAWYGPWRCYCFYPMSGTVFSSGCLRDVKDFIDKQIPALRAEGQPAGGGK